MARLLLHIGSHKTGTTSLQDLLAGLSTRLRQDGVLYPEAGRRGSGHHDLAWAIWPKLPASDQACWDRLMTEVGATRPEVTILSSEEFEGFETEHIARIAPYLSGQNVQIVVYLRNQFQLLLSNFKQNIKGRIRYRRSFRAFVDEYIQRCDYASLLDRWSNVFGRDRVTFRCFDSVKRSPGLERDFMTFVFGNGDPRCDELAAETRSNVSLSDDCTRLLWLMNSLERFLPGKRQRFALWEMIRKRMIRHDRRHKHVSAVRTAARLTTSPLYSKADVDFLRERVQEFNLRFFPLLNDPADRKLFEF